MSCESCGSDSAWGTIGSWDWIGLADDSPSRDTGSPPRSLAASSADTRISFADVMAALHRDDDDEAHAQLTETGDQQHTITAVAGHLGAASGAQLTQTGDQQHAITAVAGHLGDTAGGDGASVMSESSITTTVADTLEDDNGDQPRPDEEDDCEGDLHTLAAVVGRLEDDNNGDRHTIAAVEGCREDDDNDQFGFYRRHADNLAATSAPRERSRTPPRRLGFYEQLAFAEAEEARQARLGNVAAPAFRPEIDPHTGFWIPYLSRRIHQSPHRCLIDNVIGPGRYLELQEQANSNSSFVLHFPPDASAVTWDGEVAHAAAAVRRLMDKGLFFYIGITGAPLRRFTEHWPHRFDTMMLVGAFTDSHDSARFEESLITEFRGCHWHNMAPGGEGRSADSPHFVYVCAGRRLRRC